MKVSLQVNRQGETASRRLEIDHRDAQVMAFAPVAANRNGFDGRFPANSNTSLALDRSGYKNWGKRALDVTLVVLTLPLALPLVALFSVLLWIEGGNPFYRQKRVGRHGTEFSMLKLRTMVQDADAKLAEVLDNDPKMRDEWETTQKLKKDPRITPMGALLRATSLDELPQLWNVLKGEMSLVGPRPMMPEQVSAYGDTRYYYSLTPGLTGPWQVSERNESSFAYRRTVDASYFREMSCASDLSLMFRTVGVVLRRTGY